jgi:hypothetical protein
MLISFLAEGLDMYSVKAVSIGGRGLPSGNLHFAKRPFVVRMSWGGGGGGEPRRVGIALAESLCDWVLAHNGHKL